VSNYSGDGIDQPYDVAAGPDGALWFTNSADNSIGRISTSGSVASFSGADIDGPYGIARGPDGAMWFTNAYNNSIGRITMDGDVANFSSPGLDEPLAIAASSSALWFTNFGNDSPNVSVGRVSMRGKISLYSASTVNEPLGITEGPDGAVWFTNFGGDSVGRIAPQPSLVTSPSSGPARTSISLSGGHFAPGGHLTVRFETGLSDPQPSAVVLCTTTVKADGAFSCTGRIPSQKNAGADGVHSLTAKEAASLDFASTTFTLSR
jgi:hypothetical protein